MLCKKVTHLSINLYKGEANYIPPTHPSFDLERQQFSNLAICWNQLGKFKNIICCNRAKDICGSSVRFYSF